MRSSPIIIGIAGKKRHGKNAVASILAEDFAFIPLAFADPLKAMVQDLYGFSYEQVYGDLKEEPDSQSGIVPRVAMQEFGSGVRKIHQDTWIRKGLNTIFAAERGESVQLHSEAKRSVLDVESSVGRWVISDSRHVNEASEIRSAGGIVILVRRSGVNTGLYETHESEVAIDQLVPDHIIENDGNLSDLRQKVHVLTHRLGIPSISTKLCSKCGQFKPRTTFNAHRETIDKLNSSCKPCTRRAQKQWRARNSEKEKFAGRDAHLRTSYGISTADYERMLVAQGGGCALCGEPSPKDRSLCVDHDHTTGVIRGILCNSCNLGIERFVKVDGWPTKALLYLKGAS